MTPGLMEKDPGTTSLTLFLIVLGQSMGYLDCKRLLDFLDIALHIMIISFLKYQPVNSDFTMTNPKSLTDPSPGWRTRKVPDKAFDKVSL